MCMLKTLGAICLSLFTGWGVNQLTAVEVKPNSSPTSFAYVLQADTLAETPGAVADKLNKAQRDWVILDAHFSEDVEWQASDLKLIRQGSAQRKVLAYISIGEAENYRPYWRKAWIKMGKPTEQTPRWLLNENPDWKGNFVVKYWDKEWQKLILNSVEQAMAAGFDGVYLDIVDGFETFEKEGNDAVENRMNPETRQSYRQDMIDWVKKISVQTRSKKPDALVIPQNGSALLESDDFLSHISGIGIEDLYTVGDKKQPSRDTRNILDDLQRVIERKKPVLLIEYPQKPELQAYVKKRAHDDGVILLLTNRELKTLGTSPSK